jgi:segregation and condensation protein B
MISSIIALLFVSGEPMSITQIARLLNVKDSEVIGSIEEIKKILESTGLVLLSTNNELSIATAQNHSDLIESFRKEELKGDLTPATLQVLTLVAYMENISRRDISFIRGVQSAQSIRNLTIRGLIERSGENCSLSTDALKYLGIINVKELPEYERINKEFTDKLKSVYSENE